MKSEKEPAGYKAHLRHVVKCTCYSLLLSWRLFAYNVVNFFFFYHIPSFKILNLNEIQKVLALAHDSSLNIRNYYSDFIRLNRSNQWLGDFRGNVSKLSLKIVTMNTFEISSRKHFSKVSLKLFREKPDNVSENQRPGQTSLTCLRKVSTLS